MHFAAKFTYKLDVWPYSTLFFHIYLIYILKSVWKMKFHDLIQTLVLHVDMTSNWVNKQNVPKFPSEEIKGRIRQVRVLKEILKRLMLELIQRLDLHQIT